MFGFCAWDFPKIELYDQRNLTELKSEHINETGLSNRN